MSNKRIDQLPFTSAFALTDLFEKERDPAGAKAHESAKLGDFVNWLNANIGALFPLQFGVGDPNITTLPRDITQPALYGQLDTLTIWWWDVANQLWTTPSASSFTGIFSVATFDEMRQIPTLDASGNDLANLKLCFTNGNLVVGDSQASDYYFDYGSSDVDDGMKVGNPVDRLAAGKVGRWLQRR